MNPPFQSFASIVNRKPWLPLRRATSHDVNYILPFGYGLVFPRCYARLKTWLHSLEGECANCGLGSTEQVVSCSVAFAGESAAPVMLVLPHKPTVALLRSADLDLDVEYPVLRVKRSGAAGSLVGADQGIRRRAKPLDGAQYQSFRTDLEASISGYFSGEIPPNSVPGMLWEWCKAREMLE